MRCSSMTADSGAADMRRFAAIDIGTVTSRLLVADTDGVRIHPVAREYEVTNLGQGVDATGLIAPEALARVEAAVSRFIQVRDQLSTAEHPVVSTMVMSTSAARDAKNASAFVDMLAAQGLQLQIITGAREAELTFDGVTAEATAGQHVAVVDVGGGSTEISFGVVGAGITAAHSFDVGCRRMTERFLHGDPPTRSELEAASAWAAAQFAASEALAAQAAKDSGATTLYAVAGTATSAISMQQQMEVYDSTRVHGAAMQLSDLEGLLAYLAAMTEQEREQVVGLDPRRAPVIVAGLLILVCVMRTFGFSAFTASESDILQGMISWAAKSHIRCQ